MAASQQFITPDTPMGANLVPGGATFRVWAPTAQAVYVVLRGFDMSQPDHWVPVEDDRLVRDAHGYWAGFFPGVSSGTPFRYWTIGPGGDGFKRDPRAHELALREYPNCHCIVRGPNTYPWHDAGFRAPLFHELIVYQFHIGVYFAEDDQGKDIRPGRVSKFLDVLGRLEYLVELGVNAIEPLPVVEWQGEHSRGYNNSDFYSPEMDYALAPEELPPYVERINALLRKKGLTELTAQDLSSQVNQLKAMVDLCHVYGLAVIVDVVYNHAGGPFDDQSMRFFDRPWNRQWWDPDSYFIGGDGWAGGRIFDYGPDEVRQFLIDNARWLIDEYHIDGLRYDEARIIRYNNGTRFCQDLTDTLHYHKPSLINIAEFWDWDRATAIQPTPTGLGFDAEWNDGLRDQIRGAIGAAAGGQSAFVNLDPLRDALRRPDWLPASWRRVNCVENHDLVDGDHPDTKPRIPALAHWENRRDWLARSRSRVATGLLLTAPGIPMLFMGQEFLEDKPWHNSPDRADLLIYWKGLKDPNDRSMQDFLRFTRELCALKRRHPALRGEGLNAYFNHNDHRLLAFQRWVQGWGRDVVVVASLSETTYWNYPVPFPVGGYWHEVFNSDAYDSMPGDGGYNPWAVGNPWGTTADGPPRDGCPVSSFINIPANAVLVFARDLGDS